MSARHPRMAIDLDDATFHRLTAALCPLGLTPDEGQTILQIAQLAGGADLDDDPAERALLDTIEQRICAHAGLAPSAIEPLRRLPIDHSERRAFSEALAARLATTWARELAYAIAVLLTVSDLELAPVESELLDHLQRALGIADRRASELVVLITELVTPGARDLPGDEPASDHTAHPPQRS